MCSQNLSGTDHGFPVGDRLNIYWYTICERLSFAVFEIRFCFVAYYESDHSIAQDGGPHL